MERREEHQCEPETRLIRERVVTQDQLSLTLPLKEYLSQTLKPLRSLSELLAGQEGGSGSPCEDMAPVLDLAIRDLERNLGSLGEAIQRETGMTDVVLKYEDKVSREFVPSGLRQLDGGLQ